MMRENQLRRVLERLLAIALSFFLLSGLVSPVSSLGAEQDPKVIRVGYPIQKGLSEVDENGRLYGYTYEFLQEIAQYTGWEYEFVQIDGDINEALSEMLDMLEEGDLDLMGGMVYSEQLGEVYDYPGYSYGTAYTTLCVLKENLAINETNYHNMRQMRIAVQKTATSRITQLTQFCEMNGITPELVQCDGQEGQLLALQEGRADALLSVDLSQPDTVRTVAKFAPSPFYFATTKGNREIVNTLNSAILSVNDADPYFVAGLYEKYFGIGDNSYAFNNDELAYLKAAPPLRVAAVDSAAPVQYKDADTGELKGVSRDILDLIAEQTGLQFEITLYEAEAEFSSALSSGMADLALGVPYDYDAARVYDVALTRPYLSSQIFMAVNRRIDPGMLDGKRLALPRGFSFSIPYSDGAIWYQSIDDCMKAVNDGEVDYCYGNGFSMQYYASSSGYRNLTLIPQSDTLQKICIGVSRPADTTLLSILNKVVRHISTDEIQAIVYRNTTDMESPSLLALVRSNPLEAVGVVVLFAAALVAAMLFYLRVKVRASRRIALDNERYLQLSEISGEYIYEYDYVQDRLTLSEKCAAFFGCDRVRENFVASLTERLERGLEFAGILHQRILSQQGGSSELQYQFADGRTRWIRITSKTIRENGKALFSIGKVVDIQREREEREQLEEQAQRDSLTKLYNSATIRRLVTERLKEEAGDRQSALFIIDVDHFKEINDHFGHFTGDKVLIEVANCLRSVFRRDDILGRFGGDEFAVFLSSVGSELALARCHALRDKLREALAGDQLPDATLSIGVALTAPELDYESLYRKADGALYLVKNRGRNGFEIV